MFKKLIPLSIVCCLPFGGRPPAMADDPLTLDEVIAKNIEAVGGREKLAAVKTVIMSGKNVVGGGMEMPMRMELKRPGKIRVEFIVQGMTGVQAFDGEAGWFVMPFMGRTEPERMPPDQIDVFRDQADFDGPLLDYKKKGHKVELVGKDEVEGADVYKLKVTKKSGNVEYHFIDAEYFLTVQTKSKMKLQGTEIELQASYSDFKEVDGLIFPHSIKETGMGGSTVVFEKIELNTQIDDQRFAMPEVKKKEAGDSEKKAKPDTHKGKG
ncbi:MAG: outer membrane lipoprotein-sorting protein [Planctomycetota bacterium]